MRAIRSVNIRRAASGIGALRGQRYNFTVSSRLCEAQGYGDGKGNPLSEHPEQQPASTKAQESLEHPGPDPPDVGQGSANASTKTDFVDNMANAAESSKSPEEEASAQSGGSRSKEAVETGSSPTGGKIAGGKPDSSNEASSNKAPQPKIHNQSVAGVQSGLTEEEKRDVERHNQKFEQTHGKPEPDHHDKVGKGFWSGTGGRQGGEQDWNA
ncbi:hypothetical protein GGR50DRAFT_653197 [Xylaria sp. CBS 124048]|nr:hypothetical protein GGR50DRAFT_653197 [Xylaria sp. CBS 124048]